MSKNTIELYKDAGGKLRRVDGLNIIPKVGDVVSFPQSKTIPSDCPMLVVHSVDGNLLNLNPGSAKMARFSYEFSA